MERVLKCVKEGRGEEVKEMILLDHSMLSAKDWAGDSLLSVACWHGHEDICRFLVEEFHVDVNFKNPSNLSSPLHRACAQDHVQLAFYLISKGSDPLCRDSVRTLLLSTSTSCI